MTLSPWCTQSQDFNFVIMETAKRKKVSNTPVLNLFARNVRFYRKKLHLSQEKLAELADLHPTYISNIEQGKRNLSLQTVSQIADALNMSASELLAEISDPQ